MHDPSDRALPFWKAALIALAIEDAGGAAQRAADQSREV
jgi:hypothetical protein